MTIERYLVTAVPIVGGERVTGLLTIMWGQLHIINPGDENTAHMVDPATIEPVRMAPEYAGQRGYKCPSCGVYFVYAERTGGEWVSTTPFCGHCGQALDWDNAEEGPV